MEQTLEMAELKTELERSLGFELKSLERLDGAAELNFKALRASDGMTFAVKYSPSLKRARCERLVEHLEVLCGSKAVRRIFVRECPDQFRGCHLICTAWCHGVRIFLDYSRHEWMTAINGRFICKIFKWTRKVDLIGLGQALNFAWRAEFYRKMRKTVDRIFVEDMK